MKRDKRAHLGAERHEMANNKSVAKDQKIAMRKQDISMLVPPYIDQQCGHNTKTAVKEMLRITRETRVLLGQFYLYIALTRSKGFNDACAKSRAAEGFNIIIGALMRTIVISVVALFDQDNETSNLPKILRTALGSGCSQELMSFHKHFDVLNEAEASRRLLVEYGRRIKRGPLRQAIDRLRRVRNQYVAHFEAIPSRAENRDRALIRDLDHSVAAAAVIVGEANVFILGRKVDHTGLRKILRQQADGVRSTVERGLLPSARENLAPGSTNVRGMAVINKRA